MVLLYVLMLLSVLGRESSSNHLLFNPGATFFALGHRLRKILRNSHDEQTRKIALCVM
jgi:hypothetical protein